MKKILKDSHKGILVILIILALMQITYAEAVLSIDLTIDKNDSVTIDRLKIEEGRPTFYQQPGDYSIIILGEKGGTLVNKSINLRFQRQMNPPRPMDHSVIMERITYTSDMDTLQLYHRSKLIFIASIDVCDSDNVCDSPESAASCPQDCPLNKPDGVCNPNKDGICDPDCAPDVDPDCGTQTAITNACGNNICEPGLGENTLTCPQDCPQTQDNTEMQGIIITELIIIIILIITAAWYYNQTRK